MDVMEDLEGSEGGWGRKPYLVFGDNPSAVAAAATNVFLDTRER